MKTDYPELEGKQVIWERSNGEKFVSYVRGCNYHIGITIQDTRHRLCLNGPASPIKNIPSTIRGNVYRKIFHEVIRQIQSGHIHAGTIIDHLNKLLDLNATATPTGPSAIYCPYSQ